MWYLIFLFIIFLIIFILIYPFLLKFEIKLNVLKLKGLLIIKLFNKIKFEIKFRIKNGYIYLYFNNKEIKEKISNKNVNIKFVLNLIKQMYFRQQYISLGIFSNFGYVLDSCVTATGSGFIDVISKCVFSKIKNNKKSAHIFVEVEPKYNEDIFNLRLINETKMSLFDGIYAFIVAKYYIWRDYGKRKNQLKQR